MLHHISFGVWDLAHDFHESALRVGGTDHGGTRDGIPYLKPEGVLLFKAKSLQKKMRQIFSCTIHFSTLTHKRG